MIFKVSGLKKSTQNRCQFAFEKASKKNSPKIDFGVDFGLPKPPQIAAKSTQDAKKEDLERSLFRDAMQIAKKPSKVTGT